jgi:hypothetical protein
MKNTFKLALAALAFAGGASALVGNADAMAKKGMMGMRPMMCTMAPGKEAAGRGPMCVSAADAKMMMVKKHMKFTAMMCEPPHGMEAAGRAGYGLTCVTKSKYHKMMKM